MVDRAVLQDVRRALMVEKSKWVADAIQKSLEETINQTALFKESWVDSLTWLPDASPEKQADQAKKPKDSEQFEERWEKLRQLFPLWQLDFLLVLQPDGKVQHQLPEDLSGKEPFSNELLEMAQQELQTQDLWMTLDRLDGQLSVQVFSYLPNEQGKGNTLVVFGLYLERIITQLETDHPDLHFLLVSDEDMLGADPVARDPELLDQDLIEQAIESNRSQFDDNIRLPWNLYYAPMQLLDQTVCLVIPIEKQQVKNILKRSQKKVRQAGGYTLLAVVLAGIMLYILIVRPLRRLRAQARAVLIQTVDENRTTDSTVWNHEIKATQQALSVVLHNVGEGR
ncbi:MAG: hypothetical protein HQM04_10320 [Magnetococcales bacterium]|nr:hypothetical protein [Magnetococcales bacterium]MBF0115425.1 hypothetical protein [Magnetococcales bacterium]